MFPFCPFPFASLSIRTFRSLSAFQSVSNQLVGLVGGSHGRSELTVLHAWGAIDFRLGRRAANLAALLDFISLVLLLDVALCVAVPDALHPSSHRTGLAQRISGFRKKREEDLRKKKWSNQYENPAHQSGSKSRRFAQSSDVGLCASCCDDDTCLLCFRFGSSELRQVVVPSEEHLPLAGRKTCLPWCSITLG
ncbi:unnamed protein product [Prunus armeniaca]